MTGSFADEIVEFFLPLFSSWGYLLVFAGVFLESLFFTGWIAPGATALVLGGFYAGQGELNIFLVSSAAVIGAYTGDSVGYLIGLKGGDWVLERYGHSKRLKRGLERTESYFSRYGGVTVLFGRMLSGIDAFIPLSAGLGGMSYRRYLLFDIPGIVIWTGIMVSLGYVFGDNWETIDDIINYLGWGLVGILVLVLAAAYLVNRWRKRRRSGSEAAP